MVQNDLRKNGLLTGAIAGSGGGVVLAAGLGQLRLLPTVAGLVGADSAVMGFVVQLIIAVILGAGFGWLVWRQRPGAGETLLWGITYGVLAWVFIPLSLMSLVLNGYLNWEVHSVQQTFPYLVGYVWYGAVLGLGTAVFQGLQQTITHNRREPLRRGAIAGLLAAWLLHVMLNTQAPLMDMMEEMIGSDVHALAVGITLLIGSLAGVIFAWLYPTPVEGAGAGLIRGTVYGFLWWVAGARTLLPLLTGHDLSWQLADAQADFATLPGYLFLGAAVAMFYQWLHRLTLWLFAEDVGRFYNEGAGTQGLRALGRGTVGGLIGGLLFTLVMIQIGFLPAVANLVGSNSPVTGFLVHLLIAGLIGMSYGLLFTHQSYDIGSALGWGVSYGFFWWILGPLTLMPVLLGNVPQWTVTAAANSFPSLIGHLAYGAGLGITFYLLEARERPWWVSQTAAQEARIIRRKEQILSSAPAVWVLVILLALTLPVLLGM